jgi:hypothetical protein
MYLSDQIKLWHRWKNFLNFLPQMFNSSSIVALAGNVLQLTEVGDYEAQNLNIKQMLN